MMPRPTWPRWHLNIASLLVLGAIVRAAVEKPLTGGVRQGWTKGDPVPVSCLNRTM